MNPQSQTSRSNDFYLGLSTNSPGHILFLLQACFPTCNMNSPDSFHQMVPDALPHPVFRELASRNEIIRKRKADRTLEVPEGKRKVEGTKHCPYQRQRARMLGPGPRHKQSSPRSKVVQIVQVLSPLGKLRVYGGSHPFNQRNTQETEVIKFLFAFNK